MLGSLAAWRRLTISSVRAIPRSMILMRPAVSGGFVISASINCVRASRAKNS
jgi:hypothetical protein